MSILDNREELSRRVNEVAEVARRYFFVRIWAAPATLSLMAFKGWFIGMQDTRSPMAVDILVNGVNMLTSYLLAVHAGMGVEGVAMGTLVAQYSGLLLAFLFLVWRYRFTLEKRVLSARGEWSRLIRLNGNLFIRSLCFMVVYVGFTSLAGHYGDTQLAVSSILMKLFMLFSYFVDGFAYAGEALVGRSIGGKETDERLKSIVRLLFNWSIGVGLLFTAIYAIWGMECIGLLTNESGVLCAARPYIGWLIAMPVVSTLAFMWDGIFIGLTASRQMLQSMFAAAVTFFVLYYLLHPSLGNHGLWAAFLAFLLVRGGVQTWLYRRGI